LKLKTPWRNKTEFLIFCAHSTEKIFPTSLNSKPKPVMKNLLPTPSLHNNQMYLDYAKQLIPSIGFGSGQTVHVVMLVTIRVPTLGED
jgi:hypothetical protein